MQFGKPTLQFDKVNFVPTGAQILSQLYDATHRNAMIHSCIDIGNDDAEQIDSLNRGVCSL